MTMWFIILFAIIALTTLSILYLGRQLRWVIFPDNSSRHSLIKALLLVLVLFVTVGFILNFINSVIVIWHLAFFVLLVNLIGYLVSKIAGKTFARKTGMITAVVLTVLTLGYGWYADHHVWRCEYNLTTTKNVPPLKILMIADSHVGATFDSAGFLEHVKTMNGENPDVIFIVGDFVDDDTSKPEMIASCRALGEFNPPMGVYFVFGNHDKGYHYYKEFNSEELVEEMQKNGVTVLRDESLQFGDHFNVIGRKDLSVVRELASSRLTPDELVAQVKKENYSIVLDHQPFEYDLLAKSGVDLVLSGHTHGGQLFPLNQLGKLIGAVDAVYGLEHRQGTDFIVTSGISDWAIKFKTGTRSEYVVINVSQAPKNK